MHIIRLDRRHMDEMLAIDMASQHQNSKDRDRSEMKQELAIRFSGHEFFFGCRIGKELVGYIGFKPFFPGYRHCEVYWLAVKKSQQGRGIGTALMSFIEEHARRKGYRKVCLYTGKNMTRTRGFYEKIGYELVNEFPGYYGYTHGNTTAVLYTKQL